MVLYQSAGTRKYKKERTMKMNDQPPKPNAKRIAAVIIPILFALGITAVVATMMGRGGGIPIGDGQTPAVSQPGSDLPVAADPKEPAEVSSAGLTYRTNADGSATVTGIGSCSDRTVRIPSVTDSGAPVTAIGDSAFASVSGVDEIIMPAGVVSIGAYSFKGSSISAVTVGSSVMSIGTEAFADCFNLAAISVDGANPMFASEGGVLYNREMTVLVCYPSGRQASEYSIPKSVTEIKPRALSACPALRTLKYEGNAKAWQKVYIGSGNDLIDRLSVTVDTSDK